MGGGILSWEAGKMIPPSMPTILIRPSPHKTPRIRKRKVYF